ncbi:hypothetical protein FRC09_012791 [Ceratobasidium sp. 395]|nr:hypothetical protein FRC09_012791 [Ceratobasidium sp. 395]
MSSSGAGSSKKRGHYASRACNGCRRRRCKCDECSWSREDDARRPATKQLVETLKTKIQVLEAEVARLHAQNNPEGMAPTALSNTASLYPSNTWDQGDLIPTQLGGTSSEPDSFPNIFPHVPIYEYIFHINTSIPVGELSEGARLSLACDWSRHLVPFGDIQLSRYEHDVLLQRFFNYQVIWLIPMIPEVFLHNMLYSNTHAEPPNFSMPHYSALLHCSLLAFATAFSDDPHVRSLATRSHFAGRAKQLLDSEFARPTHSLVQALTLLAEYYCGIGERNAGYMYSGWCMG